MKTFYINFLIVQSNTSGSTRIRFIQFERDIYKCMKRSKPISYIETEINSTWQLLSADLLLKFNNVACFPLNLYTWLSKRNFFAQVRVEETTFSSKKFVQLIWHIYSLLLIPSFQIYSQGNVEFVSLLDLWKSFCLLSKND